MNQDQLMTQAEDQWLDDLDEQRIKQELKELQEQDEEEMFMQWQASMYSY